MLNHKNVFACLAEENQFEMSSREVAKTRDFTLKCLISSKAPMGCWQKFFNSRPQKCKLILFLLKGLGSSARRVESFPHSCSLFSLIHQEIKVTQSCTPDVSRTTDWKRPEIVQRRDVSSLYSQRPRGLAAASKQANTVVRTHQSQLVEAALYIQEFNTEYFYCSTLMSKKRAQHCITYGPNMRVNLKNKFWFDLVVSQINYMLTFCVTNFTQSIK